MIIEEIAVTKQKLGEVKAAIERVKNGKSPGIDSIAAAHTEFSVKKVHELMEKVWRHEKI